MTTLILGIVFLFLAISSAVFGQDAEISIPDSSGARGDVVTIPVRIGDTTNLGIKSANITLQYDPQVLIATDVQASGTIAETWDMVFNTATPGEVSIAMVGPLVNEDIVPLSGSGTLVNISFLVQSGAQIGSTSQLHFARALLNEDTPRAYDGTFTVERLSPGERLEGDVNEDDRVDRLDLLKLVVLYSKCSGVSGYDPAADFNSDGCIDQRDMIVLWQNFGATRG